jgi:D-alanyl-D-alanine carboxypeptidase
MKRIIILVIISIMFAVVTTDEQDEQLTIDNGQWTIDDEPDDEPHVGADDPVRPISENPDGATELPTPADGTIELPTPADGTIELPTPADGTTESSSPTDEPEPPPEVVHAYDNEWAFVLICRDNPLPADFEVVLASIEDEEDWLRIDERAVGYAEAMLEASRRDGLSIVVIEGYRTIERQREIYERRINYYLNMGLSEVHAVLVAETEVARPGASEHNAGLALDFASSNRDVYLFEDSAEFAWLIENSWQYGFILRYPDNALHITGFIYEPWHFRFVGVERAREITESGLTLEEFIENLEN